MSVWKQDKSVQELMPDVNKSIEYLKTCKDFTSKDASAYFKYLSDLVMPNSTSCDDFEALAKYIGSMGIASIFPEMWKALSLHITDVESQGFENLHRLLTITANITDASPVFGISMGQSGGISLLFGTLELIKAMYDQNITMDDFHYITRRIFLTLHNAIRVCPSNISVYRDSNAVLILKGFLELDALWQAMALLILAYVATDTEKEALASTETGVGVLLGLLKQAISSLDHMVRIGIVFSAFELLDAINQVAINDDVKATINDQESIPDIIRMLQNDVSTEEQKVAAEALWNLAFIDSIRYSEAVQSAIPTLKKLSKSRNKELRGACASALFQIQGDVIIEADSTLPTNTTYSSSPPSYQEAISEQDSTADRSVQVMISYQWDSKERALQIRDRLVANGYRVWMDVTNMRGDILGAMADGVQKSDVILICMTEQYKDSKSCRTEATYAFKLEKKMIPLLLQQGYRPDGWLGLLQGMDLYYAFHCDDQLNKNMGELLKAIGEHSYAGGQDEIDGPIGQSIQQVASQNTASIEPAQNWSKEDVQQWLNDNELNELCGQFKRFNGRHLHEMYSSLCSNKEKFKEEMKSDYELKGADCTVFVVALKDAFQM